MKTFIRKKYAVNTHVHAICATESLLTLLCHMLPYPCLRAAFVPEPPEPVADGAGQAAAPTGRVETRDGRDPHLHSQDDPVVSGGDAHEVLEPQISGLKT